jgi:hypothetical protein
MRRTTKLFICALALIACGAAAASAQEQPYTSETEDYSVELPSEVWKAVPRPDSESRHSSAFINGIRPDGYLLVRRDVVEGNTDLKEYARTEADTKLRYKSGFVIGKDERFTGRLSGVVLNYEYTQAGKPMAGRVYYLQADGRTVYVLHFTGLRDKLQRIQNQTDAIARSFKLKQ